MTNCYPLLLLLALALCHPLPIWSLEEPYRENGVASLDDSSLNEPTRQKPSPDLPKDFSAKREPLDQKSRTTARGETSEKKKNSGIGRAKDDTKLSDNKKTTQKSSNKVSKLEKESVTSEGKRRKEPRQKNKGDSNDSSDGSEGTVQKKEREEKDPKERDVQICDETYSEGKKGWRQKVEGEVQEYVTNCVKKGKSRSQYGFSDPPSSQPSLSFLPSAPTQVPVLEPSLRPTMASPLPTFPPTTAESDRLSSGGQEPTEFPHTTTPPLDNPTTSPVPTSANISVGAPRYDGGVLMPITSPALSPSDFPSEEPSAAVTPTPTEPMKETEQPTNDKSAVTVPVSFFSISYETSGSDPTTEEFMEAESITLQFLSQFMANTFEATASVAFEVLYGFATSRTLNPTRIGFEATVGFQGSTDFTPTSSDLDMLIRIAFGEPSSEILLEQLRTLPSTNPFSRTSSISYTLDSLLSTAHEEGDGGTLSTAVVVGGLAGLITLLMLSAVTIVLRKRAREGRLGPKRNEGHELMPGGSYDESLYTAPADVLAFPFEGTEKRSLTDSDLSYEAEMRRAYGNQYPSSLEGSL